MNFQKVTMKAVEGIALAFEQDLREHLLKEHRVSGMLAESLQTEVSSEGAVVGSDLPYARFFEGSTGAVAEFTEKWPQTAQAKIGIAAERAAEKAS